VATKKKTSKKKPAAKKKKGKSKRPAKLPEKKSQSTGPKGVNWAIFRERYVTSIEKITHAEIAEAAGVNRATVEKRSLKEKWPEQRKDHFTEITRSWRELCKTEVNAIKLENLRAIRATKTVLLRQLSKGLIRNASIADLLACIKQELTLLGEPDFTGEISHSMDTDKLREALKIAIETGEIDRTALRRASKNAG
jgi:hypothetical protein